MSIFVIFGMFFLLLLPKQFVLNHIILSCNRFATKKWKSEVSVSLFGSKVIQETHQMRPWTWTFSGKIFNHFYSVPRKVPNLVKQRKITAIIPFKVTQGHQFWYQSKPSSYDFLSAIKSNLPPILHHFRDMAFNRSKIAIFGYPLCSTSPTEGFSTSYHRKWYIAEHKMLWATCPSQKV